MKLNTTYQKFTSQTRGVLQMPAIFFVLAKIVFTYPIQRSSLFFKILQPQTATVFVLGGWAVLDMKYFPVSCKWEMMNSSLAIYTKNN